MMAQQAKGRAARPANLSLTPEPSEWRELILEKCSLISTYVTKVHTHTHTHTHTRLIEAEQDSKSKTELGGAACLQSQIQRQAEL